MSGTWAEDEIGRKWDRCFTDTILKIGGGLITGSAVSLLFFRKKWPILIGAGFGLGLAYSNCEKDINATINPFLTKSINKKIEDKK